MKALLVFIWLFAPFTHALTCDLSGPEAAARVEKVNQRYDDFFRVQYEREERLRELEKGVPLVKAERQRHEQRLNEARKAYRAIKKDHAREEALRIEWEKSQKERARKLELARLCEVQQRRAVEQAIKKGRQIPPLKEFDLEDY